MKSKKTTRTWRIERNKKSERRLKRSYISPHVIITLRHVTCRNYKIWKLTSNAIWREDDLSQTMRLTHATQNYQLHQQSQLEGRHLDWFYSTRWRRRQPRVITLVQHKTLAVTYTDCNFKLLGSKNTLRQVIVYKKTGFEPHSYIQVFTGNSLYPTSF